MYVYVNVKLLTKAKTWLGLGYNPALVKSFKSTRKSYIKHYVQVIIKQFPLDVWPSRIPSN